MFDWMIQNLGTIVIGLIVAGTVGAIIIKIVRDKKKGICAGRDCGCGNCPSSLTCGAKR